MREFFWRVLVGLLVLAGPVVASADTQVSQNTYRCGYKSPYYGRTDSVCLDTTFKAPFAIVNGSVDHPMSRSLYVEEFMDFTGVFNPAVQGETIVNNPGPWFVDDDSSAGAPTMAIVADGDHGQFEMTLAADDEAENVTLFWNDELNIDSDRDPVMVVRLQVNTMPAAAADIIVFGFASAQNDTPDSIANHAWFRLQADGDLMIESDDATTDDDDNDTTVDLSADTWYEFKIDCTVPTDCDFFYRATLSGDWTELLSTTAFSVGADVALQPYIDVSKTSGAALVSVIVDYVQVYWPRD